MEIINKAKIREYTTYKLDGEIKKIYIPEDVLELKDLILKLRKDNIKYKIIGNGSNMIISSKYDGVLIKLSKFDKLDIKDNIVKVGSGYSLSKLVLKCAKKNLSGLEFAYGIPATVGGAIYQNMGAYGYSIDDIIKNVTLLDGDEIKTLSKDELNFGYRDSIFKHKNLICLEATFELKYSSDVSYKKYMEERKLKQPLEYPSAGSVFLNPIGYSAGKLIEEAGLKGFRVNDAMVSYKHANFIVNVGRARAEDVIKLIRIIQDKVQADTGIYLETEQEYLG